MALPTPSVLDSSLFGSRQLESFGDRAQPENVGTEGSLCPETYTAQNVLPCLRTFCETCREKLTENHDKIHCPKYQQDRALLSQGNAISNVLETSALEVSHPCTGCKAKDTHDVALCFDCDYYLCRNCVMAHQFMNYFEGHHIFNHNEKFDKDDFKTDKVKRCPRHMMETLRSFCKTCNTPICKECMKNDHPKGLHDYKSQEILEDLLERSKTKTNDLRSAAKSVEDFSSRLQMQYHKAQTKIDDTFNFYCSVLEEPKEELKKELNDLYNTKMVSLTLMGNKVQEMIERAQQTLLFVDRIKKRFYSNSEILMFKQLLDSKLQSIISYNPEVNMQSLDLEFLSNHQAIQVGVRNTFGYIRHNSEDVPTTKAQTIARPNGVVNSDRTYQNAHAYESNIISKSSTNSLGSANSLGAFSTSLGGMKWSSEMVQSEMVQSPYENWSSGTADLFHLTSEPAVDFSPKFISPSMYPIRSQIKRQKMIHHCKFGDFGVMEGQFTEPSGVAVNAQNDILVADTNNHRIQVFDNVGRFQFQFGEWGKRDGQLLYPNRVSIAKTSGDIIVTERSPTHQIQIYNQYGQFVRKFGDNILQHPRGVAVDINGRIIVIECKVMRVIIFDQLGNVLQKFGCSKHIEFPNGVVVNDKEEIFISDNRTHCVKVFSYDGAFLRHIGGEGLTNYPIGVCINQNGEILVADNHNNFNITIFTQDGQLVNAFESKVKHAQCFDVALMDDGSVVLASKDYHLYIYRYM